MPRHRTRLAFASILAGLVAVAALAWVATGFPAPTVSASGGSDLAPVSAAVDAGVVRTLPSARVSHVPATVTGRVTDPEGTPIAGATVRLWQLADNVDGTWRTRRQVGPDVTTAADGSYALPGARRGTTVSVDAVAPAFTRRTLLGKVSVTDDTGVAVPDWAPRVSLRDLTLAQAGHDQPDMHLTGWIDGLHGTPQVGHRLTFTAPLYDVALDNHAVDWLRDGEPIDGAANRDHYVVRRADLGHQISVRYTGYAASYWPAWADSYATTVTR